MIKPKRLVKIYCAFPKNLVEAVTDALQDAGTVHLFDIREENGFLGCLKINYEKKLNSLSEKLTKYKNGIEKKAAKHAFEWVMGPRYVPVERRLKKRKELVLEGQKLLKELDKEYGSVNSANANEIKKCYYRKLVILLEYINDIQKKVEAMKRFGKTKRTISFGGFVPNEDAQKLVNSINIATNYKCAFEIKNVKSEDKPPSLLSNPFIIKPFEILTENYGMPSYNSVDPTFILAMTFTLLFGFMFPDAGYGIILVSLSLLVYFITRKTTRFARSLNIVLIYCGLSSIFSGLLFGEFLGGFIKFQPFLFEPTKDITKLLIFSISIGIVHLSIGLASNAFLGQERLRYSALLASLWSIILYVFFRNGIFLWIFAASAAMIIYKIGLAYFKEIAEIFIHIISYLRIGILSIAHIMLSRLITQAVIAMPKNPTGIWLGIMLMATGVILSLALGTIVVFIQSLRLHWLEFFGIYEFGGIRFKPFSRRSEYLYA